MVGKDMKEKKQLHLLLADDSEDDAFLVLNALKGQGFEVEFTRVDSAAGFRAALAGDSFEMILCDYMMPGFGAFEALEILKTDSIDVPVIIVSGAIGESVAVDAMRSGAADYLLKDNLTRLGVIVERELREAETRRQKRRIDSFSAGQTEVLEMILNRVPLVAILENITQRVEDLSAGEVICSIMLVNPEGTHLSFGAGPSMPEGFRDAISSIPVCSGVGSCGTAAALGQTFIVEDIASHPFWSSLHEASAEHNLHACWSVPVFSSNRQVLGTMSVYHRAIHSPSPEEVYWVESVSKLASLAIERGRAAEKLRESESLFRIASDAARIGGWTVDFPENRITWSDQVCEIHEMPLGTVPDLDQALLFYAPEWRDAIVRIFENCRLEGISFDEELQLITASGRRIWVRTVGEAIRDENGVIIRMQGAFQDINHRRLIDETIRSNELRYLEHVKAAELELGRSHRALKMLSSCNEMLVRTNSEMELLAEACRLAVEIGGYHMAWVGYASEDAEKRVVPMAHAGQEHGYLTNLDISWDEDRPTGRGPAGRVIRSGEVVSISDLWEDPSFVRWADNAKKHHYRSCVCLPLRNERRVFGILILYTLEVRPTGGDEMKMLRELSNDLAFGIQNIRSREEKQRTQEVVIKVAQAVSSGTGSEFFDLLTRNMVEAMGAIGGLIGRFDAIEHRIDSMSYFYDGIQMQNVSYSLKGTPCENVMDGGVCVFKSGVRQLFPEDHLLVELGIESYAGIPLLQRDGKVTGIMVVLFTKPLKETSLVTSTLTIFAARAAAELDRQQADIRIREQASLLDKARDAIIVRDLDHKISYWNKSAERIYGWSADEVIGLRVQDVLYQDFSSFFVAHEHTLTYGEWTGEQRKITKGGRELTIEGRWTLLRDDQGQPKGVFALDTDITEHRKLEEQFLRAQRIESIGTLAGGIAHDLNNILAPISMAVELLKMRVSDARSSELLDTIAATSKRGAEMVGQVLSFARGVEGRHVEVHPLRIIREIEGIVRDTFLSGTELIVHANRDLWVIRGDPTQLHQVILNLCVNARDAVEDGGEITIRAGNVEIDETFAAMNLEAQKGPHVYIEIEDTGVGITPEIMDRIFDPFFTTKSVGKGTGLGLSTSLTIIKSHGGFIRAFSDSGKGSRFRIYLPAFPEKSSPVGPFEIAAFSHGSGELVLVVDDEKSIRDITRQTLEAFGYRVLLAGSGDEALSIYSVHQFEIDVVLTDMMMPGMDGPATIEKLKQINRDIKIIATSGIHTHKDFVSRHGWAFLEKPYTADSLLSSLRQVLGDRVVSG